MRAFGNSIDAALRSRASRVVPGGMWGHQNVARWSDAYPQFFARAEGCRIWDVDGNEYVDLMCSWGPVILGHHHPAVEAAAQRQAALGDCLNGPSEAMVELAELLVEMIPHAEWALFQKNGTDATTVCVSIARAGTGRRKILMARGAYHGAAPWCTPSPAGVTAEDRAHLLHFDFNDVAGLEAAAQAAGDDLAGIIVTPMQHDLGRDIAPARPEFARAVRAICDRADAALIIDDVRCGFRLDLGGSWEPLGVRPDLSSWSKAIANGYALAAVTGNERFREAAAKVFTTGSYWCSAVAMHAAIATLRTLRETDAISRMVHSGTRLREGLTPLAAKHGAALRQSGPVQMPMVLFEDDADGAKGIAFCNAALRHGAYLSPRHNMFLSAAHGDADIDRVLAAADQAFRAIE
jgi:glutamate-1-semialdehyde 2,1-aminomutase